jgi:hypothetical protein
MEERPDDAVLARSLDPPCVSRGDEAIEHRLDLVGGGVAGCTKAAAGGELVPEVSERCLGGRLRCDDVDDLGAENIGAEPRVLLGLRSSQPVVHVNRADAVAQCAQDVPEAGRVGASGHEADDVASRWDQVALADERFDTVFEDVGHTSIVPLYERSADASTTSSAGGSSISTSSP